MSADTSLLSEKEKEALRLLLSGHDAKSSAHELDISVHTLNDRLRSARRKLGVTTSKEAARVLAASEETASTSAPQSLAHKGLGVTQIQENQEIEPAANRSETGLLPLTTRQKGLLIMSIAIAASLALATLASVEPPQFVSAMFQSEDTTKTEELARDWLALIDDGKFDESYDEAGQALRDQYARGLWKFGLTLRMTKGAVQSREFSSSKATLAYAGRVDGDFRIVDFNSLFKYNNRQIERVVFEKTLDGWKVIDYDMIETDEVQ